MVLWLRSPSDGSCPSFTRSSSLRFASRKSDPFPYVFLVVYPSGRSLSLFWIRRRCFDLPRDTLGSLLGSYTFPRPSPNLMVLGYHRLRDRQTNFWGMKEDGNTYWIPQFQRGGVPSSVGSAKTQDGNTFQ